MSNRIYVEQQAARMKKNTVIKIIALIGMYFLAFTFMHPIVALILFVLATIFSFSFLSAKEDNTRSEYAGAYYRFTLHLSLISTLPTMIYQLFIV